MVNSQEVSLLGEKNESYSNLLLGKLSAFEFA